ncbi:hypothetical protein ThesuDRAFT_01818 [Thermaerobacter subterraneus DSM 13965]|uniref:Uncharacterized protein n=1 Tax=Thermaerobacter subterraneus DSM 13965 TaxID=867903 RepID=K6PZ98_9FIRM|nr:hypothetical protein ThesuDRAFT_01818 [Thermaerobacter subterraneus DSM 13965]
MRPGAQRPRVGPAPQQLAVRLARRSRGVDLARWPEQQLARHRPAEEMNPRVPALPEPAWKWPPPARRGRQRLAAME